MMVRRKQPDYLSYLVRLWRVGAQSQFETHLKQRVWRASAESAHTGERWSFASLDELFDFLHRQTGQNYEFEVAKPLASGSTSNDTVKG